MIAIPIILTVTFIIGMIIVLWPTEDNFVWPPRERDRMISELVAKTTTQKS